MEEKGKVMDLSKCGGVCRGACKHYEIGVECADDATYEPRELKPLTLDDIKEWVRITEGKGGIGRRDLMVWLITEMERLTSLCANYREALERVATEKFPPQTFCRERYLRRIAERSLQAEKEGK